MRHRFTGWGQQTRIRLAQRGFTIGARMQLAGGRRQTTGGRQTVVQRFGVGAQQLCSADAGAVTRVRQNAAENIVANRRRILLSSECLKVPITNRNPAAGIRGDW